MSVYVDCIQAKMVHSRKSTVERDLQVNILCCVPMNMRSISIFSRSELHHIQPNLLILTSFVFVLYTNFYALAELLGQFLFNCRSVKMLVAIAGDLTLICRH